MKRFFSILLSLMLVLTMIPAVALAGGAKALAGSSPEDYSGKTVVLYTGNLRGDIDKYGRVASAKKYYENAGADKVYLVDAGNYMQGTRYVNRDRGLSCYNLMDLAGYDIAAMGAYEFSYGDATTGYLYHNNFQRYHTQKMLYKGNEPIEYQYDRNGNTKTLSKKTAAVFKVISSNLSGPGEKEYYDFDESTVLDNSGKKIGFVAQTDENTPKMLQDDFMKGCKFESVSVPKADVVIGMSNDPDVKAIPGAGFTICAPTDGEAVIGALCVDKTNNVSEIKNFDIENFEPDNDVLNLINDIKGQAEDPLFTCGVTLDGSDRANWQSETNLGDLTADALLWFAENKDIDGFDKTEPAGIVAIQNGGNCDNFMYTGEVTKEDLLRSLPFSPMGIGVIFLTGDELIETLEAATSPSDKYASFNDNRCPGFAQVAGMSYNVDFSREYDKDIAYGAFYKAASINRVAEVKVNGKEIDPAEIYAVVADNYLMNGNDTYYNFKEAMDEGATYCNNGNGTKTRDIVAMYVSEVLNGEIGEQYAEPQGRITQKRLDDEALAKEDISAAKRAAETAKKAADKAKISKTAADKAAKTPGNAAIKAANKAKVDADAALKAAKAAKAAADKAVKSATTSENAELITEAKSLQSDAVKQVTAAENAVKNAKKAVEKAKVDAVKKVKTVTVNTATVSAKAINAAVKKAGGSAKYVTKFVIGKKAKKITKGAFKAYKKATVLQVKTKKLSKKSVKGSLNGSKVKTIQVKVGKKKVNKKFVKKYKKIFTKKNAGKKVKVK